MIMRFWSKLRGTAPVKRPRLILVLVALVELYLFAGFHWERWSKVFPSLGDPRVRSGEGLVVRCDGLGYYAWLRSLLIDGDLSFDNEFDEHNPLGDFVPPPGSRTNAGRRANPWSVGPACVWATTVIPGHWILQALGSGGLPWPANGYSLPYQLLVGLTSLGVSWIGLVVIYRICRRFAAPTPAALAAACLTLGSTVVYYNALEVSMAHSLGTAALAGFVCYWSATFGAGCVRRWFVVGLLLGIAMLMRWQLATFAVLLLGEALVLLKPGSFGRPIAGLLLAAVGVALAFSPQLLAWRLVYGLWLAEPIPIAPNWLHPAWQQILLDADRGLFYWTPLTLLLLVAAVALTFARDRSIQAPRLASIARRRQALLLLLAFGLQVYLVEVFWGPTVYLGAAYGMRHLTEALVALAPGLAWLLGRSGTRTYRILVLGILMLVVANLILVSLYRYGWIPAANRLDVRALPVLCLQLVERKKLLLVGQVLAGPLMLGVLAFDGLLMGASWQRAHAGRWQISPRQEAWLLPPHRL
jgi:hypothetical protein